MADDAALDLSRVTAYDCREAGCSGRVALVPDAAGAGRDRYRCARCGWECAPAVAQACLAPHRPKGDTRERR